MKKLTTMALTACTFTALTVGAYAASFDCRKARTDIEYTICDNPTLSRLDTRMGRLYHKARNLPGMKHEQQRWIKHRNYICGASEGCLISQTQNRVIALKHALGSGVSHRPAGRRVSKNEMYQMERACKNYMADRFMDFPMAAFSVSWGHGKNGNFIIPVRFSWDQPRVEEHGYCKIVHGKVVNYFRD